ncbi:hypothetical protein RSSM_05058 [Rhodopirellula sallentina SM41]|uniref:Uncharacterized protein n=1 Tax=Rhodopirellula sallentina SM41 TaxID=1263870 RepID=M5TWT6_9BACT|nr:hypothetical protein RSSM_05058 [Rhodopirellula sallentina SM41]
MLAMPPGKLLIFQPAAQAGDHIKPLACASDDYPIVSLKVSH